MDGRGRKRGRGGKEETKKIKRRGGKDRKREERIGKERK